jgi:carbon-monoxide dehydrogenase medium subunit
MKAAAFQYQKASSVKEVLQLLATHGDNAKLMAGGQSLLPSLNMRLSNPEILIDLQGVAELKGISHHESMIRIGAMTTHTEIENSSLVAEHLPLLSFAVPHIAHRAIRNLGTWGGSCVYGDPAAEWPACAVALNGIMVIGGPAGERKISAKDFFQDLYTTDLQAEELLIATEFPISNLVKKDYFEELSRRHGDYAVAGLASHIELENHKVQSSRFVYFSVASTPICATQLEQFIQSKDIQELGGEACISQAKQLVQSEIETLSDLTNSSTMKAHLVGVLLERALKQLSNHS